MCITTLANRGDNNPLTPWQRLRQGLGFIGMLVWVLVIGLFQKLRQS